MSQETPRFVVYVLLVLVGIAGAISDAVLNQWARTGRWPWLLGAYASWLLVATLLGMILRRGYFSFGSAVVLFLLVNSLAALLIDWKAFGGRPSWWSLAGIALAALAIACMELGRSDDSPVKDPHRRPVPPEAQTRNSSRREERPLF